MVQGLAFLELLSSFEMKKRNHSDSESHAQITALAACLACTRSKEQDTHGGQVPDQPALLATGQTVLSANSGTVEPIKRRSLQCWMPPGAKQIWPAG